LIKGLSFFFIFFVFLSLTGASQTDTIVLEEVSVTATRSEKNTFDIPLPITIIDRKEIEKKSPQNIGDILRDVAGIELHHDGTPWSVKPRIRGLFANRILILVDGNRYNSHVGALTGGVNLGTIDINQVERIEVIRGPSSVLYGSDAIGGVINIITRKAVKDKSYITGNSTLTYNTANSSKKILTQVEGSDKNFSIFLGATAIKAENTDTPDGRLSNSQFEDRNIDLHIGYNFSKNNSMELGWQHFKGEDIGTPPYTMQQKPLVTGKIDMPEISRDLIFLNYKAKNISSSFVSLELKSYFHKVDHYFTMETNITPFIPTKPIRIAVEGDGNMDIETYGFTTQGVFMLGDKHLFTTGIDFYRDRVSGPSTTETKVKLYNWLPLYKKHEYGEPLDGTLDSIGIFFQDEIFLSEKFLPTVALRYDRFKSENEGDESSLKKEETDEAISGSIGFLYKINKNINLLLNAGLAFRAPNLKERYYKGPVPGGGTLIGNPSLDSEKSFNIDLGIKARFSKLSGNFTLFSNEIKDFIVYSNVKNKTRTTTYKNVGEARIYGFEGDVDYQLTSEWSSFFNISYARGEDKKEGDPLEAMPPLNSIVGLRYEKSNLLKIPGKFWGEFSAHIFCKQDRIPDDWGRESKTPGFTYFDLRTGLAIPGFDIFREIELNLSIRNITDKRYKSFPVVSFGEWDDGLVQAGRSFMVSLSCKF